MVDAETAYSWTVSALEDILYGTDAVDSRLPLPTEIVALFEANSILRVTDHHDGTWTADTDEDGIISMLDSESFEITWPSAIYTAPNTYKIGSL
jgi:hypothetical protein